MVDLDKLKDNPQIIIIAHWTSSISFNVSYWSGRYVQKTNKYIYDNNHLSLFKYRHTKQNALNRSPGLKHVFSKVESKFIQDLFTDIVPTKLFLG